MSRQAGIANAISQAGGKADFHNYRRTGSDEPIGHYSGVLTHGVITVGQVLTGRIVCTPIIMPEGKFLQKFGYRITVLAAGEVMRVGLYSNKRGTLHPDSLVKDFGEFSIAATGTFFTGVLNHFLYGNYVHWLATWVSGGAAWFAQIENTERVGIAGYNAAGGTEVNPSIGYYFAKVYDGIFPTTYPDYVAGTRMQPNDISNPGIFLRFHNP